MLELFSALLVLAHLKQLALIHAKEPDLGRVLCTEIEVLLSDVRVGLDSTARMQLRCPVHHGEG